MSPCHNRAQITLKSKQEFIGLVNFFSLFPCLSSKDDISFRHELGLAHVKLPSESTVVSLG